MNNYINSGITWIGMIPFDWKINKIKAIADLSGRIGWQGLTSDEYTDEGAFLITGTDFDNGMINWASCVHVPMKRWKEATKIQIKENDLLITKDGTVGKVAMVKNIPYETSLNSGVLLIRINENFDSRFLFYVLQSEVFWTWFNMDNSGNSTVIHLYQQNFNNFSFAFPKINEQKNIVNYLDHSCDNLDIIVKEYNEQINILKKYKKTHITEIITSGLNNHDDIFNSGIEWIGNIPKEWRVSKIKYLTSFINGYAFDSNEMISEKAYPIIRITEVTNDGLNLSDCLYVEDNRNLNSYLINDGDLLIALSGATVGKNCIVSNTSEKMYINQRVAIVRSKNNRYLKYVFQSNGFDDFITRISYGSAQPNISCSDIGNFYIPLPNEKELEMILDYLDSRCQEIDQIIIQKEKALDKLIKYKKSIIYEYVTGKKRIGGNNNAN